MLLNKYDEALMGKPDLIPDDGMCAICGWWRASNLHHIVFRSHGGRKGPLVAVCGMGNASGCHGRLHDHTATLRWNDGWEVLETDEPVKIEVAHEMEGWRRL